MGRYLVYRMHPWSVGESLHTKLSPGEIRPPAQISSAEWDALWEHGPEPFLRRDSRFTRRWRSLRQEQLSREDLREVAQEADLGTLETLMQILAERRAQQLIYSNLPCEIQVSVDTVKRWVDLLGRLHHGFTVRPWFTNIAKVKMSDTSPVAVPAHFQVQTQAARAFQLVVSLALSAGGLLSRPSARCCSGQDFPELTALSMQAAAARTEKRHRLMAYGDRCRPPARTTCLRPRISFALLF